MFDITEVFPELNDKRYLVDKYQSMPEGWKPMLERIVKDGQAHTVFLINGVKIEGNIDRVRNEYVEMNGDWDDKILIPMHAIGFVRIYNPDFQEKAIELQRRAEAAQAAQQSGLVVPRADLTDVVADLANQQDG